MTDSVSIISFIQFYSILSCLVNLKYFENQENAPYFAMADRGAMYRPPWAGPCNCNGIVCRLKGFYDIL